MKLFVKMIYNASLSFFRFALPLKVTSDVRLAHPYLSSAQICDKRF